MDLPTDFEEFLKEIRPTAQRADLQTGHKTLRERLNADEGLKKCIVSDFLQGSYRRATAIRPKGDRRSDVDIIVVTKLSEREFTPAKAMDLFKPFSMGTTRESGGSRVARSASSCLTSSSTSFSRRPPQKRKWASCGPTR